MGFKKKVSGKKRFRKIKRRVFKKRRIVKKKRYIRRGRKVVKRFKKRDPTTADYRKEEGGTAGPLVQTGGGVKYVGHGMGSADLQLVIFLAMVKKLMQKYGVVYASDEEYCLKNTNTLPYHTLELVFRVDRDADALQSVNVPIESTHTVITVANNLQAAAISKFQALWTAAPLSNLNGPVLSAFRLWKSNTAPAMVGTVYTGVLDTLCAEFDTAKAVFHIGFQSVLKLQNKTLADGGAVPTSTDNLNINPLKGRLYKGLVGQNYVDINARQTADNTSYRGWITSNTGYMKFDSSMSQQTMFRQLVDKKTVNVKSYKDFVLHPAQIVQDTIKYKVNIGTPKLMENILNGFGTGTYEAIRLGKIHVLGFDKLLWDRTADPDTEHPTLGVKLGVEYNQRYTCYITFKKMVTVPYVNFSTAINTY